MAYMAKVPSGSTAANWDGSGTVWFKIYEDGPIFGTQSLTWPSNGITPFPLHFTTSPISQELAQLCKTADNSLGDTTVTFTIPKSTPSGDYLFRVEHIGLHVAQSVGGAQFYLSCGQITVTGGGSGTPGPLVAFPGAYSATDPGILIDIYYPVVRFPRSCENGLPSNMLQPTNYTCPGPAVWTG